MFFSIVSQRIVTVQVGAAGWAGVLSPPPVAVAGGDAAVPPLPPGAAGEPELPEEAADTSDETEACDDADGADAAEDAAPDTVPAEAPEAALVPRAAETDAGPAGLKLRRDRPATAKAQSTAARIIFLSFFLVISFSRRCAAAPEREKKRASREGDPDAGTFPCGGPKAGREAARLLSPRKGLLRSCGRSPGSKSSAAPPSRVRPPGAFQWHGALSFSQ